MPARNLPFVPTIKHQCGRCGWIHDPEYGYTPRTPEEADKAVEKDVEFDDLPADFECPECESPKAEFVLL